MRRIVLWVLSTLSVLVLLFGYHTSTSGPMATSASTVIESPVTAGTSSGSGSSPDPGAGSSGSRATTSTVTGDVATTQWGPVQVELTVDGGTITKVSVLQYPSGNPRDTEINSYALPILVQETLDAQSASIDMVSGATVTSTGYLQSLQSALDQAGV
jgi:uncharacterized protein with FMN-binding domain